MNSHPTLEHGDFSHLLIPETDPDRIFEWSDVHSIETLTLYYQQRLGPARTEIPCARFTRQKFHSLQHGQYPYLAEILRLVPDAASEICFGLAYDEEQSRVLAFALESPNLGAGIVQYLRDRSVEQVDQDLVLKLTIVIEQCRRLHKLWKRDVKRLNPFGYHRINFPDQMLKARDQMRRTLLTPKDKN